MSTDGPFHNVLKDKTTRCVLKIVHANFLLENLRPGVTGESPANGLVLNFHSYLT